MYLFTEEGADDYQTDTFAERIGKGTEDIEGRNEPPFQPVVALSLRWIIKLGSLKLGEDSSRRIAIFELFEEIVVLQIFLGLFLVGLESGIKGAFDVGRRCGRGILGHRNRSRSVRLTHDDEVSGGRGMLVYARRKPLIDKAPRRDSGRRLRLHSLQALVVAKPTLNANPFLFLLRKHRSSSLLRKVHK